MKYDHTNPTLKNLSRRIKLLCEPICLNFYKVNFVKPATLKEIRRQLNNSITAHFPTN